MLPGQQATLILANCPAVPEAVWFNADQTTELYASANNTYQPVISQGTTFYGAVRDLTTGCVSDVLEVLDLSAGQFDFIPTPPVCTGGTNGSLEISNTLGLGAPVTYTLVGIGSPQEVPFSPASVRATTP
ncbi:MAG: hypothetical protein IPM98_05050 [Lewinellaceae bacterium]|nr:hypothetical protein [Lewinellaceae bacterium]